jgi:hypothetical protein
VEGLLGWTKGGVINIKKSFVQMPKLDAPFDCLQQPKPVKIDGSLVFLCQYTGLTNNACATLPRWLVAEKSKSVAHVGCFYDYGVLLAWLQTVSEKIDKDHFQQITDYVASVMEVKDIEAHVALERDVLELFGGRMSPDQYVSQYSKAGIMTSLTVGEWEQQQRERNLHKEPRDDGPSATWVMDQLTEKNCVQRVEIYCWPQMRSYLGRRLPVEDMSKLAPIADKTGVPLTSLPVTVGHDETLFFTPPKFTKRQTSVLRALRGEKKAKKEKSESKVNKIKKSIRKRKQVSDDRDAQIVKDSEDMF